MASPGTGTVPIVSARVCSQWESDFRQWPSCTKNSDISLISEALITNITSVQPVHYNRIVQDWLHGFPGLFTDTSEHICFLRFSFFPLFQVFQTSGNTVWSYSMLIFGDKLKQQFTSQLPYISPNIPCQRTEVNRTKWNQPGWSSTVQIVLTQQLTTDGREASSFTSASSLMR